MQGGLLSLGSEALVHPLLQKPWGLPASSQIKHTSDDKEAGTFPVNSIVGKKLLADDLDSRGEGPDSLCPYPARPGSSYT